MSCFSKHKSDENTGQMNAWFLLLWNHPPVYLRRISISKLKMFFVVIAVFACWAAVVHVFVCVYFVWCEFWVCVLGCVDLGVVCVCVCVCVYTTCERVHV